MGIRLEWEVESDLGRDSIGEDASVVAAEQRRQRLRVRALIGVGVVLAVIIGAALWRYKIVRDEKHRTLINTVEAEALALRIGDEAKFMRFQGPADDWRDAQRAHFNEIQDFSVMVSGKVVDLKMTTDEARVRVEMLINGEAFEAVWLYDYSAEKGWKHVATEQTPWVEQTRQVGPISYAYYSPDAPLVDDLEMTLARWWRLAMVETGVKEPLRIEVVLDREAESVEWADDDETRLIVSPRALAQMKHGELAFMMADRWALYVTRIDIPRNAFERWAVEQVSLSLVSEFGGSTDEELVFEALSDLLGTNALAGFIDQLEVQDEPDAISAMDGLFRTHGPDILDADYVKEYLGLVTRLVHNQAELFYNPPRTMDLFLDRSYEPAGTGRGTVLLRYYGSMRPNSLRVESLEPFRNMIWAEVAFDADYSWLSEGPFWVTTRVMIPFREVDGYWKVSIPGESDWGAQIIEESDHITLTYFELDAAYYGDLLPEMENAYLQAADVFGLTPVPRINIDVRNDDMYLPDNTSLIYPVLYSPHSAMCCMPNMSIEDYTVYQAHLAIYREVFSYQLGPGPENNPQFAVEQALFGWIWEQHGIEVAWSYDLPPAVEGVAIPSSLDAIWKGQNHASDASEAYAMELNMLSTSVLVEVLMERYGEDAYLPLVLNLRKATSMEDWLNTSLGISTGEIEAEWLAQYHIAIREQFGDAALP